MELGCSVLVSIFYFYLISTIGMQARGGEMRASVKGGRDASEG